MHASIAVRKAASSTSWTLANGARIPKIGFGWEKKKNKGEKKKRRTDFASLSLPARTWKLPKDQAGPAVSHALKTGFRQIDSAWGQHEDLTGAAIRKSGIDRKDIWITSKLWNTFHGDKVEIVSRWAEGRTVKVTHSDHTSLRRASTRLLKH